MKYYDGCACCQSAVTRVFATTRLICSEAAEEKSYVDLFDDQEDVDDELWQQLFGEDPDDQVHHPRDLKVAIVS